MEIITNNLILKTERIDRDTFILICYDDGSKNLIIVKFENDDLIININDILKQQKIIVSNFKLFKLNSINSLTIS